MFQDRAFQQFGLFVGQRETDGLLILLARQRHI